MKERKREVEQRMRKKKREREKEMDGCLGRNPNLDWRVGIKIQ